MIRIIVLLMIIGSGSLSASQTLSGGGLGGPETATIDAVCVEGYKYVVVRTREDVAVTQMYEKFNSWSNPPIPVECKK